MAYVLHVSAVLAKESAMSFEHLPVLYMPARSCSYLISNKFEPEP